MNTHSSKPKSTVPTLPTTALTHRRLLSVDPSIQHWLNAADSLKKSSLQYTRVIPGFFMDYWGMPPVRTNLQPVTFGMDMVSCQAAIPGDGNDVIGMTYTYDMAEFLIKLLELEEWPEFSIFVGDDVTYNELLRLAEEVRGKTRPKMLTRYSRLTETGKKFQVTYDSVENVKQGRVTVPPMPSGVPYSAEELREMTVLVSRLTVAGVFDLPVEQRMNSRFPDLRPIKVKEFLLNAWKDFE